ncbi:Serine/threonine protein kinase [Actinopolymorpha cephalotaxi]|uniref:non-specific serine/threonine protein kinase n=1 Tax=Actinopolymorpha cephalotaxi TaxID=504797 RepID=A0A1I2VDX5_9ACTN|nr:serine/threonine-protein kinase [Actinopolymorpha cephalotaxi]NYH84812.1 serine/threonine protein kinase [Actinopolymorpha cephalotaxi]SFG86367.1 Serine/threonine protein kinase [Actinopolymorpha cephalotaxi]
MRQVGRYRMRRVLGSGAFATVWLGEDPALEVHVAIKVLAENWANNADVRERFLAEARLLRRVDDPRLVRVFDVGESEDDEARPYFVMEYIPGGTLTERIGSLSTREALAYGVAAGEAVQVLHDAGIVHRDVKPSNLLIDDRSTPPRLVVSDLGSAKVLAEASGFTVTTGTPSYMAPEQIHQTDGFDGRADVYAVAAVTYHLLTGQPAFSDHSPAAVLDRRADTKPPPVAARLGRPAELDRLLARSLSWDPGKRPGTAAEFARELGRFLADDPHLHRPGREVPTVPVLVFCVVLAAALFAVTYQLLAR